MKTETNRYLWNKTGYVKKQFFATPKNVRFLKNMLRH